MHTQKAREVDTDCALLTSVLYSACHRSATRIVLEQLTNIIPLGHVTLARLLRARVLGL